MQQINLPRLSLGHFFFLQKEKVKLTYLTEFKVDNLLKIREPRNDRSENAIHSFSILNHRPFSLFEIIITK